MKRCLSISLFVLSLFFAVNAQKLVYGGLPKAASKTAGTNSYSVNFAKGISVYKIQKDENDNRKVYFELKKDSKTLGKIDADVNAFGGELSNFYAFLGDLDKNKSDELIVVDFIGQSNGLGVSYYTVNIFPDFETKGFTTPLTFKTSEFGKNGTFVYDAKTNETLILQTEWGGVEIKDPKRGSGLYFTGRFFRYKNGKLKPVLNKPTLARRYLNSFEKERFQTEKNPRRPYLWLTSPAAIKISADPIFSIKPADAQSGIIEKYENIAETYKNDDQEIRNFSVQQIVVKLDSGESKTIILSKSTDYPLPDEANKIQPVTFGMLPAKLTLPSDFSPAIVFDKLEGRKVQLNSYVTEPGSEPVYRLWFIE